MPVKSDHSWVEGVALIIAALIFEWLGYKGLDVPVLRPFAIGVMIVAGIVLVPVVGFVAFAAAMILRGLIMGQMNMNGETSPNVHAKEPKISERLLTLEGSNIVFVRNKAALDSAGVKIVTLVDQHLETLARRRLALVKVDHYGVVEGSDWNREVQHFVDRIVRPQLSTEEAEAVATQMKAVFQVLIEDRVASRVDEMESDLQFDEVGGPIDFERWCAKELEKSGWKANVTKASGDQGADVLARKGDTSVILQCKLYSSPVGNKAVQEAFSAQRHYATRRSAVVSNASYTKSAQELARTTRVLLLHFSDLSRLESLLSDC